MMLHQPIMYGEITEWDNLEWFFDTPWEGSDENLEEE